MDMKLFPVSPLLLLPVLAAGQNAPTPRPSADLKNPAGQRVAFQFRTLPASFQIYTCRPANDGFAWAGPDPDAVLISEDKTLIVHHYKGPTWEAQDGSKVRSDGKLAKHFLAPTGNAIHWLELPAQEPTGKFAGVTFIHRIDTAGGLPPSGKACDAQHAGEQERVSYSATYLFYAPTQR